MANEQQSTRRSNLFSLKSCLPLSFQRFASSYERRTKSLSSQSEKINGVRRGLKRCRNPQLRKNSIHYLPVVLLKPNTCKHISKLIRKTKKSSAWKLLVTLILYCRGYLSKSPYIQYTSMINCPIQYPCYAGQWKGSQMGCR